MQTKLLIDLIPRKQVIGYVGLPRQHYLQTQSTPDVQVLVLRNSVLRGSVFLRDSVLRELVFNDSVLSVTLFSRIRSSQIRFTVIWHSGNRFSRTFSCWGRELDLFIVRSTETIPKMFLFENNNRKTVNAFSPLLKKNVFSLEKCF